MKTQDTALIVEDLGKSYDGSVGVIDNISFTLPPGSFFTLLGPSGCGKTTTLRCIAGLEQPQRGSIRLGSDVVFDAASRVNMPLDRRNFGMVFQSYAIWPHLTVFENVAFPLRVSQDRRYDKASIRAMVDEALSTVGLAKLADRSATRLSGGQQQRVALARAIVRRPRLLMLDEPLSNLDAVLREEMRMELKRLQQQLGITTVYVTHDQSEALEMSDTIAVLNRGRLVQLGTPQELYFNPSDAFVAGFMGSPNILGASPPGMIGGDGLAAVTLTDGRSIVCRFPHPLNANEAVAVSVRAETINVVSPAVALREGHNRLPGTVITTGFQGEHVRYAVDIGGAVLQATGSHREQFRPGAAVALDFAHDATLGLRRDSHPS